MLRLEGPSSRPVAASTLRDCVRLPPPPHEGSPHASRHGHVSRHERADQSWCGDVHAGAVMSMCFAALARMNRASSTHGSKARETGSVRLAQAIPWRDHSGRNDISTKIKLVTSVMFPGIQRPYGGRRSAVLPAFFPTLRSMSGTLEIS